MRILSRNNVVYTIFWLPVLLMHWCMYINFATTLGMGINDLVVYFVSVYLAQSSRYNRKLCLPLLALTLIVIISSPDSFLFKLCAFSGQPDRLVREHKWDTIKLISGLFIFISELTDPCKYCRII